MKNREVLLFGAIILLIAILQPVMAQNQEKNTDDDDKEVNASIDLASAVTPATTEHIPKGTNPGIPALFAIAGLLAVAYIILRQKK